MVVLKNNKYHVVFWSIAVSVFILDRITKELIVNNIPIGNSINLGFFSLTHILNKGTLWGLFQNAHIVLAIFAFIVSIYIVVVYKNYRGWILIFLALILAGALGNLYDRFLYGAVIDFINFHFWPVFNVADSAISISVVGLLIREFHEVYTKNMRKV